MAPLDIEQRIRHVADFPHELGAYQRWLEERRRRASGERDYLFSEERPRFEPRKDDVVMAAAALEVRSRKGTTELTDEHGRVLTSIEGVSAKQAERLLEAMDGQRCLLEVGWRAKVEADVLARFLRATFGRVVFAPQAVATLDAALPAAEIARFPGSPYTVERPYWDNMVAVRARFLAQRAALDDAEAFVALLQSLHVVTLMGERLNSFYKPASPVSDVTVAPGNFYLSASRLLDGEQGSTYLDGPRVKVPLLGGLGYHQALCESVDDAAALEDRQVAEGGVDWGRVVTARSERDSDPTAMFLPPRPIGPHHLEALRAHLGAAFAAAEANQGAEAVSAAARFHWAWVRLHPFHCANQSLAMNLAGAALKRAVGAGIPHLILDHLALRLVPQAYEQLFARAVAAYAATDPNPSKRLARLIEGKQRSFSIIEQLSARPDAKAAILRDDPEGASWALLA